MITIDPVVLYDVELAGKDVEQGRVRFRHRGCGLILQSRSVPAWPVGAVGRLTVWKDGDFGFLVYADPRLRRMEALDKPSAGLWGWRLGEYRFLAKSGVLPGLNGAVVREDVEPVTIPVPFEFRLLCEMYELSAANALRAFIADVCALQNDTLRPREDGYRSSGDAERLHARAYWLRTYGH